MKSFLKVRRSFFLIALLFSLPLPAAELNVGDAAPLFSAQMQDGTKFDLASRKGQWTVLFFYPKAGTPGCTKQACAFRDNLDKIRALKTEVYGISSDTVSEQAAFHKEHKLSFNLLADPDQNVIGLYGAKKQSSRYARRWTFILGPDLKIRNIMKDVNPALDSERVAKAIAELQKK